MILTLAAKLFVDPLAIERFWPLFGVLLMLLVGIGYKAITTPDPGQVPRRAAWFLLKSTGLMFVLGLVAWLITVRN